MDPQSLSLVLKGTMDPDQRNNAEKKLLEICKIINFGPNMLQIIMSNDVEMPTRQAGAIYLKNFIIKNWIAAATLEAETPMPFHIHEQDRNMIRNNIVEAVILAPELIRNQLTVCVNHIIKHDFPAQWSEVVQKISTNLSTSDFNTIYGALLCLLQLVKNFEYKKRDERNPLNESMKIFLPQLFQLMMRISQDASQSEQGAALQKETLKIFYSFIQYLFPPAEVMVNDFFTQWMKILTDIVDRVVPPQANEPDESERPETLWWKCKKWSMKIIHRIFERYGSPKNVSKEYKEFSDWYLKTFSAPVIDVLLRVLDRQRRKEYVSPAVLQYTLNYLNLSIGYAHAWSLLKEHMLDIVKEVIFPILCHSPADEELWESDPLEYIRVTYDSFDDILSYKNAAECLLHSSCSKRKRMLSYTVLFLTQMLQSQDVHEKDGALCMIGSIADVLFKKELYKDKLETMLYTYVFPEFKSQYGFMRARASCTLAHFAETKFQNEQILVEAVQLITNSLLTDNELRVKVQAAISLQIILTNQSKVEEYLRPQIKNVTLQVLEVIRETKNDDLTNTLQKIISVYQEELVDLAVDMCRHLAETLSQLLETSDGSIDDEHSITAMSLLNTMETIVGVMEDQPVIITQIRPIVLQVAVHILKNNVVEFYEEAFSLLYELTCSEVSPEVWAVLEILYEVFQREGSDYFMDMMPLLHNYVTVDTATFLSNENYLLAIFNMCKAMLGPDVDDDPACHAAKLLEVIILQCQGRIDQCIPSFIDVALTRLLKKVESSELRTMCLQIVIAAVYYNPQLVFDTLNKMQIGAGVSVTENFIEQWLHDVDCFFGVHDRKISVVGLCTVLLMSERPPQIMMVSSKILPSIITLLQGLKKVYAARQEEGDEDSDDDDVDSDDSEEPEEKVLSSDEDEVNDEELDMVSTTAKNISRMNVTDDFEPADSDEEDDDDDEYEIPEETALESYATPLDDDGETGRETIDEFFVFKNVLLTLQNNDPNFYEQLTINLDVEQQKILKDLIVFADERKAAAESKELQKAGGFSFVQQAVPTSFSFGVAPQ